MRLYIDNSKDIFLLVTYIFHKISPFRKSAILMMLGTSYKQDIAYKVSQPHHLQQMRGEGRI